MRKTQQLVVTITLAVAAAISCSGCLALMVPGLAYSGYKYEHNKNETAANAPGTQSNQSTSSTQQKTLDAADIE